MTIIETDRVYSIYAGYHVVKSRICGTQREQMSV
jgi:hypothetical protein